MYSSEAIEAASRQKRSTPVTRVSFEMQLQTNGHLTAAALAADFEQGIKRMGLQWSGIQFGK